MSKYPSQLQDKFNLRFPDGMRDAIAERAKKNGRSMNSEIIQMIEDALNPRVKSIEFDIGENKPIKIDDVGKAEDIVKALTEFATALAALNKKSNE
ncbi:Arc family DNA-binding protein [Serratia liquefaciens]|uniref:Arc family DNA-binding protein n=1 Tax=Serratia liquefaciens TaxID=614 RepID=UPI0023603BAA|nr:Arc family DNA-binding protein [Serratia liquefaciens]